MLKHFRPRIRTRHPSHSILRNKDVFPLYSFKSVIRLGSTTEMQDTVDKGGNRIQLNTVQAVKNSSNKGLMKQCFEKEKVKTAKWWIAAKVNDGYRFQEGTIGDSITTLEDLTFPIISKSLFGSRGKGNIKHDSKESLEKWLEGKNLKNYIFEKFYNFSREYRLHITEEGCFYTCRKMLKSDTPDKDRWYRNDDHCVWIMENNELFDKPICWDEIIKNSVLALKGVGLDFGAVDVKVQSATNKKGEIREEVDFIIIEINSAPSFGEETAKKYKEMLPILLLKKFNKITKNG